MPLDTWKQAIEKLDNDPAGVYNRKERFFSYTGAKIANFIASEEYEIAIELLRRMGILIQIDGGIETHLFFNDSGFKLEGRDGLLAPTDDELLDYLYVASKQLTWEQILNNLKASLDAHATGVLRA